MPSAIPGSLAPRIKVSPEQKAPERSTIRIDSPPLIINESENTRLASSSFPAPIVEETLLRAPLATVEPISSKNMISGDIKPSTVTPSIPIKWLTKIRSMTGPIAFEKSEMPYEISDFRNSWRIILFSDFPPKTFPIKHTSFLVSFLTKYSVSQFFSYFKYDRVNLSIC